MDAGTLVAGAAARLAAERGWPSDPAVRRLPEVAAILKAPDDVRRECVLMLAAHAFDEDDEALGLCGRLLLPLAARKRLALSAGDIAALLALVRKRGYGATLLVKSMRGQIEAAAPGWSREERERLAPLIERAAVAVDHQATATALRRLVAAPGSDLPLGTIAPGDDFCARARAAFESADEDAGALGGLLEQLSDYPPTGRAPAAWKAEAARRAARLRAPASLAAALLDALLEARDAGGARFLADGNQELACGVVALAGETRDAALLPRLRRLAVKAVTVIGGEYGGPRSLRLANACAHAIVEIGAPASLAELLALERAVRHGGLLRVIRAGLDTLAAARGMTRDELLELAVETHGWDRDGTRSVPLSRGAARIEAGAQGAALAYVDEHGRARKSFPAAVREADGDAIAGLRAELKQIRATIAGERRRIDGLLALDRRWALDDWRERYLDHPVTGRLTRALIWRFGEKLTGLPRDGRDVLTSAAERAEVPDGCEVRLWHPIGRDDVEAWRRLLLERAIAQPVKQAFREVYPLGPGERGAGSSDRFAGHVFLQARARALMKARGWTAVALAWWDDGVDHGVARRDFDAVRAELAFDPIVDVEPEHGDLYPLCTSGDVSFTTPDGKAVALDDVPRVVLSEAMRDVDLFIAVASIGADPGWAGRGFDGYWQSFGFGALGQPATIRRAVLEHLLPGLAIAERCSLDERFLVVRGDLRSYRIHLGSGNVLMEPGSVFLPVAAERANRLSLPFDDDPTLDAIVGKAFLLAGDARIEDAAIARLIRDG